MAPCPGYLVCRLPSPHGSSSKKVVRWDIINNWYLIYSEGAGKIQRSHKFKMFSGTLGKNKSFKYIDLAFQIQNSQTQDAPKLETFLYQFHRKRLAEKIAFGIYGSGIHEPQVSFVFRLGSTSPSYLTTYMQLVQYPEKSTTCSNPALILNTCKLHPVEGPGISSLLLMLRIKAKRNLSGEKWERGQ